MKSYSFVFLALSLKAFAYLPPEISRITCYKQIEEKVALHKSKDQWVRMADPQPRTFAFKTPTKEFGTWIEVQALAKPYLFVFSQKNTKLFQWDEKCKLIINNPTPPLDFLKSKLTQPFTDQKLEQLVNSDKFSVIYIWSTSMTYSMSEMKVFMEGAKNLKLNFVPVLDFNSKINFATKKLKFYQLSISLQHLQSLELFMRGTLEHYPTTFVVGHGKIAQKIFGVLTPELLDKELREKISTLSQTGEGSEER